MWYGTVYLYVQRRYEIEQWDMADQVLDYDQIYKESKSSFHG